MVRSMVVAVAGIGLLFGGYGFVVYRYHHTSAVTRVDDSLAASLTLARAQAPYPLLAPAGLPRAWAPTSVRWDRGGAGAPAVLHVGWVTPSGGYADLEESTGPVEPLLAPYEDHPAAAGTTTVAGVPYAVNRSRDGSLTYLRTDGTRHLGVGGGAPAAELEQLLTALR
jgi:hypothetical protein